MSMFTRKPETPTREQRANEAAAKAGAALSIFTGLADDLEQAAHEQIELATEASEEAEALLIQAGLLDEQAADLDEQADSNFEAAKRIRSLLG